jgi:hypothetical protein
MYVNMRILDALPNSILTLPTSSTSTIKDFRLGKSLIQWGKLLRLFGLLIRLRIRTGNFGICSHGM